MEIPPASHARKVIIRQESVHIFVKSVPEVSVARRKARENNSVKKVISNLKKARKNACNALLDTFANTQMRSRNHAQQALFPLLQRRLSVNCAKKNSSK